MNQVVCLLLPLFVSDCSVYLILYSAFKRRAPRCMDVIRKFAQKAMCTEDVRIDPTVNQYVWSKGIHNVPTRIRIQLDRQVNNEDEEEKKVWVWLWSHF